MKTFLRKLTIPMVIASLALTGCARNMDSSVYTSSDSVGKVLEGRVVSARSVTIKETDKVANNQVGTLGGGLAGGMAGSAVGAGNGQVAAIVGGALLGAVLGAVAEDALSTSEGIEYVVRIDPKYVNKTAYRTQKTKVSIGRASVDDDIKQSISVTDTKSDMISVVQGKDVIFNKGQKVLIIYNNDRPRLASAS